MHINAQIAAAILGFAMVGIAHPEAHQHAHHHHRRQVLQELPDGEVGFSAPAQQVSQQATSSNAAPASSWTPQPSSTSQATPSVRSSAQQTSSYQASQTTLATAQVTSKPQTKSTETAANPVQTNGDLTINVVNKYGTPLSLVYGNNAGGPPANGNPKNGMLATSTSVTFPTGWAGRMTIGKDGNPAGSKIEGSFFTLPDIDVSYVDGYSVPITCSCSGTAVTGCNLELFDQGTCQTKDNDTCINTISGPKPDGPAMPFFAPCQGAAYTYPNDNDANVGCQSHTMDCCIGTSCDAPSRQKVKSS